MRYLKIILKSSSLKRKVHRRRLYKEESPSPNILFKLGLLRSLGLLDAFRGRNSADNPCGVHEYRNVRQNSCDIQTQIYQ